jgi:hypothetical protein
VDVVSISRRVLLAVVVAVMGCSAVATAPRTPVTGLADLADTWSGWLVTSRDTLPAVLDIDGDGGFRLIARRIDVVGAVTVHEDGSARFEAGGVWHGAVHLRRDDGRRVLDVERDDRDLPGRFHARMGG